jgi:hypothetical protein
VAYIPILAFRALRLGEELRSPAKFGFLRILQNLYEASVQNRAEFQEIPFHGASALEILAIRR